MGLPNAFNKRYLRFEPRTRIYSYVRALPSTVAPHVCGTVPLPWTHRAAKLKGRKVVKISLGACGLATAESRWAAVHAEIEALVQAGEQRVHKSVKAKLAVTELRSLPPENIVAIADRVHASILTQHDRSYIDPGTVGGLQDQVAEVMLGHVADREGFAAAASHAARQIKNGMARRALSRRDLSEYESPIREFESDVERAKLTFTQADVDAKPILSAETLAEIEKARFTGRIEAPIDALLAAGGVGLPAGHIDRKALALAVARAEVRAYADIKRRERGEPIETPVLPRLELPNATSASSMTLSRLHEEWKRVVRPDKKSVGDNLIYVNRFIEMFGDLPAEAMTNEHFREYRDTLARFPRNLPHRLRKAPIAEIIAYAEGNPDLPLLSPQTINEKALRGISKLLAYASGDDGITRKIPTKLFLRIKDGDVVERQPFSIAELNTIFRTSIYTAGARPIGGGGEAAFWLPLIALFTGARIEEIGQLLVGDIKVRDGVPYFLISTIDDDGVPLFVRDGGNRADDNTGDDVDLPFVLDKQANPSVASSIRASNSIKTAAGKRIVPVHAELVRCGFLDYVLKQVDPRMPLFPDLRVSESGGVIRRTKAFSQWFGRHLDQHVVKSPAKVFHSFRHNFISQHAAAGGDYVLRQMLIGHARTAQSARARGKRDPMTAYLHATIDALNDEVQKVSYRGLQLAHLHCTD